LEGGYHPSLKIAVLEKEKGKRIFFSLGHVKTCLTIISGGGDYEKSGL